jgi:hypothetical protein
MNDTTTIEMNDEICTISYDTAKEDWKSKQKHTILYIGNPFDPEDLNFNGIKERPEPSVKGEDLENDKAWKKYNRAEVAIQKKIIDRAAEANLIDKDIVSKLKWSRKAGCGCGCSPGWKLSDHGRRSIWLTVTSPSKEEEKRQRQKEYASKKEAETLASLCI